MTANRPTAISANGGQDPRTRILVPLDGSELATKALPVAAFLARKLSAELHLVSVVPLVILPYITGGAYVPANVYQRLDDDRQHEARQYLDQAARGVQENGIQVQTHLERGDAASALLDLASKQQINLVVMTTHGRTGLARLTLGSVADRVVRSGAAPVLLVRSFPASAHDHTLSHALVPLDGSPLAEKPLDSLVTLLAGPVLQTVTLVRVADPRNGDAGRQQCEQYLNAVRDRLIGRLAGRNSVISALVRSSSNPAAAIVAYAEEGACDLVLMSTHGEAGIGRLAFGSVTDRVLRDGKTPLLLVHPPHH